jgi:hypothetical protein
VWCWDVTYLPGTVRGMFFYLFAVIDLYSRKLVAWEVHASENGELAAELIERARWRERRRRVRRPAPCRAWPPCGSDPGCSAPADNARPRRHRVSGARHHGPSGDHTASRAPDGMPPHCARHRPAQTTLYRLVQQHTASFIAYTEASTGARLPRFVKDEFDALLQCGILTVRPG